MLRFKTADRLAAITLATVVAACTSSDPVAYSGIDSAPYLASNRQDESGRVPYRYAAPVGWRSYSRVILDPVAIYRGSDSQFDDTSEADKAALADYMQRQFVEKLSRRFQLATDPAPNTLRVRLTLTGAASNTPVLSTFTRIDLSGGIYNSVQAARGGEGLFTGSVIYAVEIYDSSTNRLLTAFVTKQYPGALNIGATLGSLAAAKAGIDKGADALLAQLSGPENL